jgi:hypothetical protein
MKTIFLILSLFILSSFLQQEQEIPELNKKIIEFVKSKVGKKVGRGECWDLAQIPLDENGAKWDHLFQFGKKIDPMKDVIFPGDIIQFEKVEIKYEIGNKVITEGFYQHTAIVYEVLDKGVYKIAQQNTEKGKKVTIDDLDLKNKTKGKILFFRPEK